MKLKLQGLYLDGLNSQKKLGAHVVFVNGYIRMELFLDDILYQWHIVYPCGAQLTFTCAGSPVSGRDGWEARLGGTADGENTCLRAWNLLAYFTKVDLTSGPKVVKQCPLSPWL